MLRIKLIKKNLLKTTQVYININNPTYWLSGDWN